MFSGCYGTKTKKNVQTSKGHTSSIKSLKSVALFSDGVLILINI